MAKFMIIAATSGIGQALTAQLASAGHTLFLTGRDESRTEALAQKHSARHTALDATDFEAVADAVHEAQETLGGLDGVACLAGSLLLKSAHATTQQAYMDTVHANLTTAFATVAATGKHMREGGAVVLMSSAAAMHGLSNHEAIAAAKGGIIALSKSAAATYAGQNLRVNAVAPGLTETPMTKALTANDASRKVSEGMHALGRLGTPDQIARAIAFLLAPENDWITGQVLGVDGGLSTVAPKIKV